MLKGTELTPCCINVKIRRNWKPID